MDQKEVRARMAEIVVEVMEWPDDEIAYLITELEEVLDK
jgi:hypothetical protein